MTIVFDTLDGLPVHALVLHATVVLLPLMSLVTFAVAARPRWRRMGATVVAVLDLGLVGLTWVTIESGEWLQNRLSNPGFERVAQEHAERGDKLLWFAIALFVVALLVALFGRRGGGAAGALVVLAAIVGVSTIGWTYYVGESGAASVWKDRVANAPGQAGG